MTPFVKRDNKNIHKIESWPPGTFMVFDNSQVQSVIDGREKKHVALGIVVANDGDSKLRVLWGANCGRPYCEYHVFGLNPNVIFHMA